MAQPETVISEVLLGFMRELLEGPPPGAAFMLNPGDDGLIGSPSRLRDN